MKKELARKAKEHYENIQRDYQEEIQNSINRTTVYGPAPIERIPSAEAKHKVLLVDDDSVSCIFNNEMYGRICVLNFASYKNPGGFFLGGSTAQEEALCHESTLYPVLLSFDKSYYEWNKKHLNRALYLDRALYSKDILFEHYNKKAYADVLTCAAPNYRTAHKFKNVSISENETVFKKRIKFMYDIAEQQEVNTLIAGAWGCGVFMQSPEMTCKLLMQVLRDNRYKHLEKIYLAIPDENSRNFRMFEDALNDGRWK